MLGWGRQLILQSHATQCQYAYKLSLFGTVTKPVAVRDRARARASKQRATGWDSTLFGWNL
ncbi:MAG: hypothetical protein FRX49_01488 [Trebouxia sp. A1-2]|nr:MAG: hypothetical protein FRX49_01488 [Trebouxia sp. A1-2]